MGDAKAVVHFTVDGAAITATALANAAGAWSFSPTGLTDGSHTIVASETNSAGTTGTASLAFTLDTTAPAPIFVGATQANGQVTLTGATGGAGDTLSIYDGYTWLGFATTGSDGRFSFSASASSSVVHSYGANASDLAGHGGGTAGALLLGSATADTLAATSGGDVIQGAGGADTLTGGSGADRFAYNTAADSTSAAADTITDFQHGADKIDFTNIAGINATNGLPQFQGKLTGGGNLTLNAHSVAYMEVAGNTVVLANTSNVAETVTTADTHAADMKIVLLGVNLGLTGNDFNHT
jgi:Ca2+-binding RTX toxin-like protein